MPFLKIGEMTAVLKWERVSKASDETGGQHEGYMPWFTCRGKMIQMSAARKFNSGYDEKLTVYQCWMPWRSEFETGVTKDARVIYNNQILYIQTWRLEGERRGLYYIELKEAV